VIMWLKNFILKLITKRHAFKTYGGHPGSKDVWLHERWWRIFSRKKHHKVTKERR